MPSWWGKSSSKAEKKTTKESFIDAIHRKLKIVSEEKSGNRSRGSRRRYNDTISEKGSLSRVPSRSPSPSTHVSRCQSFAERPHAHPLPLPGVHLSSCGLSESGINASTKLGSERNCEPSLFLPLPRPRCVPNRLDPTDHEGDLATASISSDSTIDSDDPSDSRLLSPLTSDYENGNRTAVTSPSSVKQKDKSPIISEKSSGEILKSANLLWNNQILSTSRTQRRLRTHVQNLQIPNVGAFCSAPDSSMSSPSRSPIRAFGSDQVLNAGFWTGKTHSDIALLGSGHCSSPGSGHNSGHNSVGGDLSGQPFWPHSRCSPECSPIPSPRMTSPGPSSRIHSGAVSPLHPRAGGPVTESTGSRPEDGKQKSHRLPLPPLTISKACPFSPTYSTATSPSVPRSPSRVENPISPGSRWKKGRLLGRGTFGHVYLGFNSESGEMCAMKEVTLFSDDAKSRESAQQLGQEIALLSRLRHPNIVRYYGSETVEDKLYIYLEYVSGGSIYKILQDYGQLGESAIRSYTKQILSGLQYLHAKNTVHRDIKGANILVDPNGRVKLADFGMAKHITGQSCPLSFKGSPYWMAPEVIKNSNGSNLAVDIWSLGCTVLEMATTKPPWHQYEGVAAMFKIGNSKELPETPDHLSDEGKDFVKKCLQRNPLHRPSAAQLLEHPFVKHAASLERPILTDEPSETLPALTNTTRAQIGESLNINLELVIDNYLTEIQGIGQGRYPACFDSEGAGYYQSMGLKNGSGPSDTYSQTTRNMSCPVSPISSPLLRSRSPQQRSGRMSPSPISSPHTASGSSTPLTGGSGGIPFHHSKLLASSFIHEGIGAVSRSQNNFHPGASNTYQVFREVIENASPGIQFGQPVLADHVSQQLLRDHLSLNPSVDLNPSLSTLGRGKGF